MGIILKKMSGLQITRGNSDDDRVIGPCDLCKLSSLKVKHCITLSHYDFPRWKLCLDCDQRLKYFYGGIWEAEKAAEQEEYERLQLEQLREANEELRKENATLQKKAIELALKDCGGL